LEYKLEAVLASDWIVRVLIHYLVAAACFNAVGGIDERGANHQYPGCRCH